MAKFLFADSAKHISESLHIEKDIFLRISFFYIFIQLVIWAKVLVFFVFTGTGQSPSIYSYYLFVDPFYYFKTLFEISPLQRFDLLFHQAMHFLIAFAVFAFSRHVQKISFPLLFEVFFVAAFLHNVGYWFTNVFSSAELLLSDFIIDIAALFLFFFLFRLFNGFVFVRKIRLPLLE